MNPLKFYRTGISKNEYQKVLMILGAVFVVSGFVTFLITPVIVDLVIKFKMSLKPGHYLRKIHENLPFQVKFYLWNITNPDEIGSGAKPVMQEVGPYVFDVSREKFNQEDNDKDDTFSYDLWNTYKFRLDLTAPLTGDENLVMLNTILVAGIVKFQLEKPAMIPFMATGVSEIFNDPTSIFINVKAREILFEGIEIDCNRKSFPAKTVCSFLKKDARFRIQDDKKYNFAIFNAMNDTLIARYTVKRGSKNSHVMGEVTAINGESELEIFEGNQSHCNTINGTDRMIFPGFQEEDTLVWVYVVQACRSVVFRRQGQKKVSGIKTTYKDVNLLDEALPMECNSNAYLPSMPKGSLDLYPCVEVFLIVTAPHFLNMEESFQKSIEGIHPDYDLHHSRIYFHLHSGAAVETHERAQISTKMMPAPEYPLMRDVQDVYVPFYWYDEEYDLYKGAKRLLYVDRYSKLIIAIICYTLMISSALTAAGLTFVFLTNHVPTTPDKGAPHEAIEEAIKEINQSTIPENNQY